mmetsp:Transcript_23650/g.55134  ORF Transcript_23650/g.55134 Transcript_23650/m.55134 type:complete len:159 (-) Transcript_23650:192-668(-)|eukprot:CAMPEP_0178428826 /NCGR_PEP_ID=MMETSP0689_2-20121128/30484_1 /TAXON_ID=160604 /ORGANISM="Amphidinium massartii, Strain CS-259" /LENGTH=158 /DNA_ID=CAMNT_0020050623 /DNA_START=8 /DNA_END=484 /DNA_ORIENTATION=+
MGCAQSTHSWKQRHSVWVQKLKREEELQSQLCLTSALTEGSLGGSTVNEKPMLQTWHSSAPAMPKDFNSMGSVSTLGPQRQPDKETTERYQQELGRFLEEVSASPLAFAAIIGRSRDVMFGMDDDSRAQAARSRSQDHLGADASKDAHVSGHKLMLRL